MSLCYWVRVIEISEERTTNILYLETLVRPYKLQKISHNPDHSLTKSNVHPAVISAHCIFVFYLVCEPIGTAATPGLLCQPRVIVKKIVEKQMECTLAG
jgi:hypothetical protein